MDWKTALGFSVKIVVDECSIKKDPTSERSSKLGKSDEEGSNQA